MDKEQIKRKLIKMVCVGPLNTVFERIDKLSEELALEFDKLRSVDKKRGPDEAPLEHKN